MDTPVAQPVALITGGSAGLGLVIARSFAERGYRVAITGRDPQRLDEARELLNRASPGAEIQSLVADAADADAVDALLAALQQRFGRLDVLVNCVGTSDRGRVENLSAGALEALVRQNVTTALLCSQAALPLLVVSQGAIVNIGSLASKVGARYLGGYCAAKHALAGMTQQMRLELAPQGVHVGLVSPGPIRRADAGSRYASRSQEDLPAQANAPGGGTRVKGLAPERVAEAVVRCAERRIPDLVLPGHLRLLIATGHALPRLGDWLLLKFTSSKAP